MGKPSCLPLPHIHYEVHEMMRPLMIFFPVIERVMRTMAITCLDGKATHFNVLLIRLATRTALRLRRRMLQP
jgi:hypothetical protein